MRTPSAVHHPLLRSGNDIYVREQFANWTAKTHGPIAAMTQALIKIAIELSLHSRRIWAEFKHKITQKMYFVTKEICQNKLLKNILTRLKYIEVLLINFPYKILF